MPHALVDATLIDTQSRGRGSQPGCNGQHHDQPHAAPSNELNRPRLADIDAKLLLKAFAGVVPDERLGEVWFPVECQYLFQPFGLAGATGQEVLLIRFHQNQLVDAFGRGRVWRQDPAADC